MSIIKLIACLIITFCIQVTIVEVAIMINQPLTYAGKVILCFTLYVCLTIIAF